MEVPKELWDEIRDFVQFIGFYSFEKRQKLLDKIATLNKQEEIANERRNS